MTNEGSTHTARPTPPRWQPVLRTILQTVVALAASAPLIYTAITRSEPEAAIGGAAVLLTVAGTLTRVITTPAVDRLLQNVAPWLVKEIPVEDAASKDTGAGAETLDEHPDEGPTSPP